MSFSYGRPARSASRTSRGTILIAIVGLHAMLALALTYVSLGKRPEAEPVPVQVTLLQEQVEERPPPPPPPRLEVMPVQVVAPEIRIPVDVTPTQSITVVVQRTTPPPAAPPQDDAPLLVENVDYLRQPSPRYPPAAKRARVQGTVLVQVLIGPDGRPLDVIVHRSSGSSVLDAAACSSVWEASFRPHRENGVARTVRAIIPVEFALASRGDRGQEHSQARRRPGI